jgi:glycolate oxidase iron-sulfur subunit
MNQWAKGELPGSDRLFEHIQSCLGCLGCQTACPSGVKYGAILDAARPQIAGTGDRRTRRWLRYVLAKLLPDYVRLAKLGALLRLWQQLGFERFTGLLSRGPGKWLRKLAAWQAFLPAVPKFKPLPRQSWVSGEKRGQVLLFSGCVMDILYNQVNHACVRLLAAQRRVVLVPEQTCCGALAAHAGETDIARELARRNIELLEGQEGQIVVTAAGCGAMLKAYGELFEDDSEWRQRAHAFSSRVVDITESLAEGEFCSSQKALNLKVTYHAACHLAHAQGVRLQPAHLLAALNGLEVVPLEEAEHCCGSAGIFNLTHTDLSLDILARKIGFLEATGADVVVTTNPGCLIQLQYGLKQAGSKMKALHLAELLDKVYCSND